MLKKYIGLFALCAILLLPFGDVIAAQSMGERLAGKLLLQVEQGGRIWYVSPSDYKRYEVTFDNALPLFEEQSLGISNADLNKIPIETTTLSNVLDSDGDGFSDQYEAKNGFDPYGPGKLSKSTTFGKKLSGKLLLQVEQAGRIWYVDFDGYRHEVTWDNLMQLFKSLSLGITNADLNKITIGSTTDDQASPLENAEDIYEDDTSYLEDGNDDYEEDSYDDAYDNTDTYTEPSTSYSNEPPMYTLLSNFNTLSTSEVAQLYKQLDYNDMLMLSTFERFGQLVHLSGCYADGSLTFPSSQFGTLSCTQTYEIFQNSLQFVSWDSLLQNAETDRLALANSYNCANGTFDQASCNTYFNTTQAFNQNSAKIGSEIVKNFTYTCDEAVDPNCAYYNTY